MEEAKYYRPLGFHERYSLARAHMGFPVIISLAAKTACKSGIESLRAHLEARVDQLLRVYPSFSASIIDDRSRQPSFTRRAGPALSHPDVFTIEQDVSEGLLVGDDDTVSARILSLELHECGEGKKLLFGLEAPMWRVVLRWRPGTSHCWLSLSVNHNITDGRGAANLFELLLMRDAGELLPSAPLVDLPPTSDQVFDMNPPLRHVIPIFFEEVLLPLLPAFIRRRLQKKPHWPANRPIAVKPSSVGFQLDLFSFEMDTILRLKRTAQSRGIKTVTPLLQLAAFIATSIFVDEEGVSIGMSTPINMRGQAGLHATSCTGNYVTLASWTATPSPSLAIWPTTRDYARLLADPNTIKTGCWTFGMLAYVPDAMRDPPPVRRTEPPADKSDDKAAQSPTSWQHFFEQKMRSDHPYATSFGISNLGIINADVDVERLAWAQTVVPVGAAFSIDICGFKGTPEEADDPDILSGGLSICVGSRKGVVAEGALFASRMKNAITILTDVESVPEDMTLEQISRLVLAVT